MVTTPPKKIYTAGYGQLKGIPQAVVRVAISQALPQWLDPKPRTERRLAPSWQMLKMLRREYDEAFARQLQRLSARAMYELLPSSCVLLCWEAPNVWCHRRAVAEWFEGELGIVVREYGMERADSLRYSEMPEKSSKVVKTNRQGGLF